jgi:capsule biosynthesis phosphatase
VIVDLDGTLTHDEHGVAYPEKRLNESIALATRDAAERDYGVMVLTARGMRTYKNDRQLVEQHVLPQVEEWLRVKEVDADHVQVAKPWCGPRGFYVDDRNLHLEEYTFRFSGPLSREVFAGVVLGDPAPLGGLFTVHRRVTRAERWLDMCAWRYDVPNDNPLLVDTLMNDDGDGRVPTWALVIQLGTQWLDVAGWFAYHLDLVTKRPVVMRRGDAGFALVPLALVEGRPLNLDTVEAVLGTAP